MDDLISRQAAVDVADAVWSVTGDKNVAKVWDQIKDLPSAQPEKRTEKRTETHACDLIDRQAAIDIVEFEYGEWSGLARTIVKAIKQLPSAQPEEDCDTCKHGYFMDAQCERCRVRYPSHYEREAEHHGSD